jgi:hypothetical protein
MVNEGKRSEGRRMQEEGSANGADEWEGVYLQKGPVLPVTAPDGADGADGTRGSRVAIDAHRFPQEVLYGTDRICRCAAGHTSSPTSLWCGSTRLASLDPTRPQVRGLLYR